MTMQISGTSGLVFPDSTTQSTAALNGGAPSFTGLVSVSYTVTTQAPANGMVWFYAIGPYRNGLKVSVGPTSALGQDIIYFGDDINNNTKGCGGTFSVKSGSWFLIGPWPGYDPFETVICGFYPYN